MKGTNLLIVTTLIAILLSSCREKPEDIPTLAPKATVPVIPTASPIPPTSTPSPLVPRYDGSLNFLIEPKIEIGGANVSSVSIQNPAYVGLELTTASPLPVYREISRTEDDGRVILIDQQAVATNEAAAFPDATVQPGIHKLVDIWVPQGAFLGDGSAGDFVYLEKIAPGLGRVRGEFRASDSETLTEAYLVFDMVSSTLTGVAAVDNGEQLEHQPGDIFLTQITYLDDEAVASVETGTILIFDENGELILEEKPLPDGQYQIIYRALTMDSVQGGQFEVDNSGLVSGQQAYLNPQYGYQFLLPEKWPSLSKNSGFELSEDPDSSLVLSVTTESGLGQVTSHEFKEFVLGIYGDIQILYEEAISAGDINTTWMAYSYDAEDGRHTGVFLPVVNNGWGHVIDLEGLSADEDLILNTARIIVDSLVIRPLPDEKDIGEWGVVEVDRLKVPVKSSFLYNESRDDWYEFIAKDGFSFIAFKRVDQDSADLETHLVDPSADIASMNSNLALSEVYKVGLGANEWQRIDFSYSSPEGTYRLGFFMALKGPSNSLLVWAESTPEKLESLEVDTFFPMLLDLKIE